MAALPISILLKSNAHNKFLCYSKNDKKSKSNEKGFLILSEQSDNNKQDEKADLSTEKIDLQRFKMEVEKAKASEGLMHIRTYYKTNKQDEKADLSTEKIDFQRFKFEVEKAKTAEGLVHIRTCYNNKYWVRKSADSNVIVAQAMEAEEDQSKWSCTLFKPVFLEADADEESGEQKMRLLHVGQGCYVGIESTNLALVTAESEEESSKSSSSVFTAKDSSGMAVLPEYVAFMGSNGKYARLYYPTLHFAFDATDIGEQYVAQKIIKGNDNISASIIINYWPFENEVPAWTYFEGYKYVITMAKPANELGPVHSYFSPIKIDDSIALKGTSSGKFLHITTEGGVDMITADGTSITNDAVIRVAEAVRKREILDATYDLEDSRVYNSAIVEKFSDTRTNSTSVQQTGIFEVEYKTSQTMTWTDSVTVSFGIAINWSAGIPFVGELGLDVSYDRDESWEWGESMTEEKTIKFTQTLVLPPNKKVSLKVLASKASCDVPFTCKVRDLLIDGTFREYTKTDGVYVGVNEFQFNTVISEDDV